MYVNIKYKKKSVSHKRQIYVFVKNKKHFLDIKCKFVLYFHFKKNFVIFTFYNIYLYYKQLKTIWNVKKHI